MPRKDHGGALAQEGPRGLALSQNMIQRTVKDKGRIALSEQVGQIDPNLLLVLIHDAIGHIIAPVHRLPRIIPVLQEIARSLDEQQFLMKDFLLQQQQEMRIAHNELANRRSKLVERSKARSRRSV